MRSVRSVLLLAGVAIVVGCNATESKPTSTPPPAPSAPATTTIPAAAVQPAKDAKPADTLKSAMKAMEDDWTLIEKSLAAPPADLTGIAKAAEHVAVVMKLAHTRFEDKEVPKFAEFGREAEAAFLDLAKKAKAGDADAIKALAKTLQPQHCARCHDAVEAVHG